MLSALFVLDSFNFQNNTKNSHTQKLHKLFRKSVLLIATMLYKQYSNQDV